MYPATKQGALLACVLGVSLAVPAQQPATANITTSSDFLRLRFAAFDPVQGEPQMSELLTSTAGRLFVVQFAGTPSQAGRDGITNAGGEVHGYLPDNAYVVRMPHGAADSIRALPQIRWVGRYHAAYRIDPDLIETLESGDLGTTRYNMVVVDKHNDKPALGAKLRAMGGRIDNEHTGSLLFTATLTPEQLVQAANLDEVLWIDAWTPNETDVDNARAQSGTNYVEQQAGYSGATINLHIYEGVHANHPGFSGGVTNVRSGGNSSGHGTNTAGIVFGDGTGGGPQYRGFAPDAGKFFTNYSSVQGSRYQVVDDLVNIHNVSHTTASWGGARTTQYTSISADSDDIIFDHDIAWTQSQSNAGNPQSRPQAWAKNIFSCGGFGHGNNANPNDDSWQAGNGSTGPAADGRIKPTLAAYYDGIGTTSGGSGYTNSFGGTSGATPIIAGHNAIAIEMFVDDTGTPGIGPFGNVLRNPGGTTHQNRPHFTTLKCLQVANASQYPFTSTSNDNRREHVGWGYPNLQRMWDLRSKTLIVDETDVITQGSTFQYDVTVNPNEPQFGAVLNWSEPAANPSASPTLINNLSLRVTAPNGTMYWGNNALEQGNWSVAGGSEDTINSIECVFVQNPAPGSWTVEVIATSIVADNHVETPAIDADFGLVVSGGFPLPPTSAFFSKFGQGCEGSPFQVSPCSTNNENGGTLTGQTSAFEYGVIPTGLGAAQVDSFELYTRSTGGTVTVPAHIYTIFGSAPIASTTMTIGPNPGFYEASFPAPVPTGGTTIFMAIDVSGGNVVVPNLTSGSTGVVFRRTPVTGVWGYDGTVTMPAYKLYCQAGISFAVPELGNNGDPVLGSSYDITLGNALDTTATFCITGFSDQMSGGTPLPFPLPGAPGCELQVAAGSTFLTFTDASGNASQTFNLPSDSSYIGLNMFHQWAVLDVTKNALGIVVSDAGKARLGN
ncbi:MAG: hypothetical protein NXI31_08035 [bacterium]|nr:hypothetical protein [bacterium]